MKYPMHIRRVLGFALAITLVLTGAQCTKPIPPGTTEKTMNTNTDVMQKENGQPMMEKKEPAVKAGLPMENKEGTMMQKSETPMMGKKEAESGMMPTDQIDVKKESMMKTAGQYLSYSSAAAEQYKNMKRVLFFHAPWCPTCKAANLDLTQNIASIPVGVIVLKTDYDTEKELKQKYGITYQHTYVQIGADGNEITKWNGGGVKELVANVK